MLIDLRSDTVTRPTREMRLAMAEAEVGDDVFREDPTVTRLQKRAAEIFDREDALFVPTGTMGNQIAIRLHTRPGQEVISEARSHVFNWELATMATFSGCLSRPVFAPRGQLTWSLIEKALSPDVYYRASTGLIVLENTHNMAGGTLLSPAAVEEIVNRAHAKALPVHMDGARIFNASAASGKSVSALTRGCDSVMFCLSKGLSAPVGSMLVGDAGFIEEAWRVRKSLGGGMRQVGILAAAGLIALEKMPLRLHEDHENARTLAEGLARFEFCEVDLSTVQTNIVIADLNGVSSASLLDLLRDAGILAVPTGPSQVRFVTHKDVSCEDIKIVLDRMQKLSAHLSDR